MSSTQGDFFSFFSSSIPTILCSLTHSTLSDNSVCCVFVCVAYIPMSRFECKHAISHLWRSENNFKCETYFLLCFKSVCFSVAAYAYYNSWPANFRAFPYFNFLFHHNNPGNTDSWCHVQPYKLRSSWLTIKCFIY